MAVTLPIFGRDLSNEVIATVYPGDLGSHCENLERFVRADPGVLFVDQQDRTKDCRRACALRRWADCAAWHIQPGPAL